jgi:hypothetical protein
LGRNCKKFFPDQPEVVGYRWTPSYFTSSKKSTFTVLGVESTDCPASLVTIESNRTLVRHQRVKRAGELGIQTHPPGEILARDLDAYLAIEAEQNQLDSARDEAESAERPGNQQ